MLFYEGLLLPNCSQTTRLTLSPFFISNIPTSPKAVSRRILQGYLPLDIVHEVPVLEHVVDRAELGAFDTTHADWLLAQHLSAQPDAVWAVTAPALRARKERIPLFHAIGFPGSQACDGLLSLTTLVEGDDVILRGLFATSGQLRELAAARVARSAALSSRGLISVRAANKEFRGTVGHVRFLVRCWRRK